MLKKTLPFFLIFQLCFSVPFAKKAESQDPDTAWGRAHNAFLVYGILKEGYPAFKETYRCRKHLTSKEFGKFSKCFFDNKMELHENSVQEIENIVERQLAIGLKPIDNKLDSLLDGQRLIKKRIELEGFKLSQGQREVYTRLDMMRKENLDEHKRTQHYIKGFQLAEFETGLSLLDDALRNYESMRQDSLRNIALAKANLLKTKTYLKHNAKAGDVISIEQRAMIHLSLASCYLLENLNYKAITEIKKLHELPSVTVGFNQLIASLSTNQQIEEFDKTWNEILGLLNKDFNKSTSYLKKRLIEWRNVLQPEHERLSSLKRKTLELIAQDEELTILWNRETGNNAKLTAQDLERKLAWSGLMTLVTKMVKKNQVNQVIGVMSQLQALYQAPKLEQLIEYSNKMIIKNHNRQIKNGFLPKATWDIEIVKQLRRSDLLESQGQLTSHLNSVIYDLFQGKGPFSKKLADHIEKITDERKVSKVDLNFLENKDYIRGMEDLLQSLKLMRNDPFDRNAINLLKDAKSKLVKYKDLLRFIEKQGRIIHAERLGVVHLAITICHLVMDEPKSALAELKAVIALPNPTKGLVRLNQKLSQERDEYKQKYIDHKNEQANNIIYGFQHVIDRMNLLENNLSDESQRVDRIKSQANILIKSSNLLRSSWEYVDKESSKLAELNEDIHASISFGILAAEYPFRIMLHKDIPDEGQFTFVYGNKKGFYGKFKVEYNQTRVKLNHTDGRFESVELDWNEFKKQGYSFKVKWKKNDLTIYIPFQIRGNLMLSCKRLFIDEIPYCRHSTGEFEQYVNGLTGYPARLHYNRAMSDPLCERGILNGKTCCAKSCRKCGGDGCSERKGGESKCCMKFIKRSCFGNPAPCKKRNDIFK